MKTVKIEIPEKLSDYIESLMYEVNARRDLLAFCVERGMDVDGEVFQRYHKQYVEFNAEYELAKKNLTEDYVAGKHPNAKWNLDFMTHTLTVEVQE